MTRSEEELRVGTQTREAGRVRLRKYVTTEQVAQTVPVQREEVRFEREPITDANLDAATSGPAISEEEHEVTLHEETPVVEKRVVPASGSASTPRPSPTSARSARRSARSRSRSTIRTSSAVRTSDRSNVTHGSRGHSSSGGPCSSPDTHEGATQWQLTTPFPVPCTTSA
jgi:uncharacterized protein (TIGR02271 family)